MDGASGSLCGFLSRGSRDGSFLSCLQFSGGCVLEGQSDDGRTCFHKHTYDLPGDF